MRLFITGVKHSGKSTWARIIAARLGVERADSDELMLARGIKSVREFYKSEGPEAFMKAELDAVSSYISSHDDFVLSLGGGAADNKALMDLIASSGTLVYLQRDEDLLLKRMLTHGIPAFLDADDVEASFHRLFVRRDGIYREYADVIIDLGPYRPVESQEDEVMRRIQEVL